MGLVSVQGLTVSLSVALVVLTGFIVGFLSIGTGNRAIRDARETGARGVNTSLQAGRLSAETVTNHLLGKVLDEIHLGSLGTLEVADLFLQNLYHRVKQVHPNFTTDPDWVMANIAPMINAQMRAGATAGLFTVWYLAPAISPRSVAEGHAPVGYGGDGKDGAYYSAGVGDGTAHLGDDQAFNIYLPVKGDDGRRVLGNDIEYGGVDFRGNFLDLPCVPTPSYSEGERSGRCQVSMAAVLGSGFGTPLRRAILNAQEDDGSPLNPVAEIVYTPLLEVAPHLSIMPTLTFTHEDQVTLWPRQGKRVGMIGVNMVQERISSSFANQEIPDGSLLYGVERNPWTGEVGMIVGASQGESRTVTKLSHNGRNLTVSNLVHVTNISDPDIAEHGKYTMGLDGNYEVLMNMSKEGLLPWVSSTTQTKYYTRVRTLVRGNLKWYLVLLVPHHVLMAEIDLSVQHVQEVTDQETRAADERKDRNFVIMMVIVVVLSVGLMGLSYLLTRRIVSPLVLLQKDMEAVAVMELEMVDQDRAPSSLSEVKSMQLAFKAMVANLLEYRNYMPQSILVGQDTEDDSGSEGSGSSKNASDSQGTLASTQHTPGQGIVISGLRTRRVSFAVVSLTGWHAFCLHAPETVVAQAHHDFLFMVLHVFFRSKGVPETFSGDRLMGTFNAVKPCSSHKTQAVHAALACKDGMNRDIVLMDGVDLHFAVVSGEARLGNLGCTGMKKFTFISPSLTWAFALERVAKTVQRDGLVDQGVADEVEHHFSLRFVDGAVFPKVSPGVILLYEVLDSIHLQEEEWMYQLQEGQNLSTYREWNLLAKSVAREEWEAATVLLDKVRTLALPESDFKKMAKRVHDEKLDPLTVLYH